MKIDISEIHIMLTQALDLEMMEVEEIGRDDDLTKYGLDSISSIQLVVMLEEKYNIVFNNDDLIIEKYNTPNKLIQLLEKY